MTIENAAAAASMGPRRDWRGYLLSVGLDGEILESLQWGHAVIGVDTRPRRLLRHSPRPLQWGHAVIGVDTSSEGVPTEEPRRLQWGHAVIGVDTGSWEPLRNLVNLLQWGHAVIGVDTTSLPRGRWATQYGFNGATP